MSRLISATVLCLVALAFGLSSVACDSATTDCRTVGQECAEGFSCLQNSEGAYECLSSTSATFNGSGSQGAGAATGSETGGEQTSTGSSSAGGSSDGPATTCLYPYGASSLDKDFGLACTEDSECVHGVCMLPGDEGNITNEVFGFCTRGCNCDDSSDAQLSSEDGEHHCVHPGGCFIGESQGAWRHAAARCSSLDDCLALDTRYTDCATTDSKTVVEDTCGSLKKVCQAHVN